MKILVTGAAGFIGFHITKSLLEMGYSVVCIDNFNSYYSTKLKKDRVAELRKINSGDLEFLEGDLVDAKFIKGVFRNDTFSTVLHLAAQAGVRYSISNPMAYIDSNVVGFMNILEEVRQYKIAHFMYASSSSVYGMNEKQPFETLDKVDSPVSFYAATKRSNELFAHTYSHLYQIPTTALRFFTVYGPYGRPDMAYYKFTNAILNKEKIQIFNEGNMMRDFTYISDVVDAVISLMVKFPKLKQQQHSNTNAPFRIFNIGNNTPIRLLDFITEIEDALEAKADIDLLPMQQGDVIETYANIDDLVSEIGKSPNVSIKQGIEKFVAWYKNYNL